MSDPGRDPGDPSAEAAEYVLRLMSPAEAAAFERRLGAEPALAAEVAAWVARLAPLAGEIAPVPPPARVKAGLMERAFGPAPAPARGWLRFWQALSGVSLAGLAVLAWIAFAPAPPEPGALYVAEIVAADETLRVLAVYDPASGAVQLRRTAGGPAAGRALELWAIAEGAAPVSLGLLPAVETGRLALPEPLRPGAGALTLAISDEPPGGSPTGQPTGAVLALGGLSEI